MGRNESMGKDQPLKYPVSVAGHSVLVEIDWSRKIATIDKRVYVFEKFPWGIKLNHRFIAYDALRDNSGKLKAISFDAKTFPIQMAEALAGERAKKKREEVHAPLNGQAIKVLLKEGVMVKEGQVVLMLEAMKMENEIVAPASGKIAGLTVAEKDIVKAGQLLFRIEPSEN